VLVVLEGLEGVGKTTMGLKAAARLGAEYVKSPPPELNSVRAFVASSANANVNFYFYLAGLHAIQNRIGLGIAERGCVIVDRYLSSTIAYHDAGHSFDAPPFDDSALRKPDFLVRVTCDETLRRSRIADRGLHIYERSSCDEEAIDGYLANTCDIEIRNDGSLEDAINRLVELIAERLGKNK